MSARATFVAAFLISQWAWTLYMYYAATVRMERLEHELYRTRACASCEVAL